MKNSGSKNFEKAVNPKSFAALHDRGFRTYFFRSTFAMMADSIEHVISYWIVYELFQSPTLLGFAVIAHWVPHLLFSILSGALADKFDPRRIIQIGMSLYILVSLAWGILFFTNSLEMWHAVILLIIHGMAGVIWTPSSQLLLHDIIGSSNLQSGVRLMATSRWLGLLLGPAIGGLMLISLGPTNAILLNVVFYLPLTIWLWKAPYGPAFRPESQSLQPRAIKGFSDILSTIKEVSSNRTILSLIILAGLVSFFIGNAYQAQMPGFATLYSSSGTAIEYSFLLAAEAAGALIAGLVLESRGLLKPNLNTAFILTLLWCFAMIGFAFSPNLEIALVILFFAGFLELTFNAMIQTIVQIQAPEHIRGRVIGLYIMASLGLRAFSGVTIGIVGGLIGIQWSLGLGAGLLLLSTALLFLLISIGRSSSLKT